MLSILGMNMTTAVGELRSVCDKWNYLSKRNKNAWYFQSTWM